MSNMLAEGTKLICKSQKCQNSGSVGAFNLHERYTVSRISIQDDEGVYYYIIDSEGVERFFTSEKDYYYIYDCFYLMSEWRDKQIDSILND